MKKNLLPLSVLFLAMTTTLACSKSSGSSPAATPSTGDATPTDPAVAVGAGTTAAAATPAAATTPAAVAETATLMLFTNAVLNQTAGACGTLTFQTQNAAAAQTALVNAHTVNLTSSSATGAFYSDTACATAITSIALAVGANGGTVYYKDTTVGTPTVTATDTYATALTAATQAETVTASTPVGLAFSNAVLNQSDSTCGALTITVVDASGAASPAASAMSIDLSSNSTSGEFFSDAACSAGITTAQVAAGASAVTVYYRDDTVGAPSLTATAAGVSLTAGTQAETIIAGPASMLAFDSASATSYANRCILLPLTVASAAGTLGTFAADATFALSSTAGTAGVFYYDAKCKEPATSVTIAAGVPSTTIFYVSSLLGKNTLSVTPAAGSAYVATSLDLYLSN